MENRFQFPAFRRDLAWTLLALALLLAWDASGLDLPLAALSGSAGGFALQGNAFLLQVMHQGGRLLGWSAFALLVLAVWCPFGMLRRVGRAGRVQFALTVLLSVLLVSLIKYGSRTSCPWDLAQFGGVARHVSHWAWGVGDGGPGRCFPGGHASAAFAWFGGWFVLRPVAPRTARRWLVGVALAGLALGGSQQLRGAHFASHTFWTAWLCWSTALAVDALFATVRAWRHPRVQPLAALPGGRGA